jgi:hypothetical protein
MSTKHTDRKGGEFTFNVYGVKHIVPYRVRTTEEVDDGDTYGVSDFRESWYVRMKYTAEGLDEPVMLGLQAPTRPELWERVEEELKRVLSIQWTPKILVYAASGPYQHQRHGGRSLGLAHELIEVGVRPDGSKTWRKKGASSMEDGLPKEGVQEPPGVRGNSLSRDYETISIIDDTAENRRKLRELNEALCVLGERFSEAFSPERVAQTLAANTGTMLLGASK